jgi:CRP-like cAMP-binding protein
MDNLLKYIHSLSPLSEGSWQLLQTALSQRVFRKNQLLLKEGQVCNYLFYIDSGYCRSYYEIDGQEKNTGFFFENDIVTNLDSFGSGQKAAGNIIACETLTAILFDKEKLFLVAKESAEIEALGRCCIRLFASKQEAFSRLLRLYSARERLEYIEKNYPHLLQRVPLTQLASFLGIARETLSRIRKRRMPH